MNSMMRNMETKSVKYNFIMNAILTLSSMIFPLITFPYISRILLPEGTGKIAFASSFLSYFSLFSQLGIPSYGIRACAQVRDDKETLCRTVQELLIINLVMSMLVYVVLFIILRYIPRLWAEKELYLLMSITILTNTIGIEWMYRGLEQYTYITIRTMIFKVISIIFMFLLVHEKKDYLIYAGLTILAASGSSIMNLFHAHKYIIVRPLGSYCFNNHIKAIAIFFAMSCATTIYTHIDSTMLGLMSGNIEVGYYDAAVKIRTILLGLVTSLGAVLLPRSSYYVKLGKNKQFEDLSVKAVNFVFISASPLVVFFIIFARPSILILSGEAYLGSVVPMQFIMLTVLLAGITNILGIQILVPLGKEKIVLYSEIAGAITDLIINALLIPVIGACGAAIGTLAAEAVVLLVQYCSLRDEAKKVLCRIHYCKLFLALFLAVIASYWTINLDISVFLMFGIAISLFYCTYILVLFLTKEPLIVEVIGQMMIFLKDKI